LAPRSPKIRCASARERSPFSANDDLDDACATPRAKFQPRESSRVSPLPTEFVCLTLIHGRGNRMAGGGGEGVIAVCGRDSRSFYRTLRDFLRDTARTTGMWVTEYAGGHSVRYAGSTMDRELAGRWTDNPAKDKLKND